MAARRSTKTTFPSSPFPTRTTTTIPQRALGPTTTKAQRTVAPTTTKPPVTTKAPTTTKPKAPTTTVPKLTPAQQKALVAALAPTGSKPYVSPSRGLIGSGGRPVAARVPAAAAPVTRVQGGMLPQQPMQTINSRLGPAASAMPQQAPVVQPPMRTINAAVQGADMVQQQAAPVARGLGSLSSLGMGDPYDALFTEGQMREEQRKAILADAIAEIRRNNEANLADLVVPTNEEDFTGDYDAALGGLVDYRDQLAGEVGDLFNQQIGTIRQDQNRYLSNINQSGAAATSQINSLSSQLQSALGVDKATADQITAQYQRDASSLAQQAEQQGIASNPLVQQQQAAAAVQNAYRASGFTPQEMAAMANNYAGKVASSVASAKADAGYRYADAYNEAFNNQKKAVTDIFTGFNKSLADLLTGKTTAKSRFYEANRGAVKTRGDQTNESMKTIVDAIDKMERTDPYIARAMTDMAAQVRTSMTVQGAAERNAASIAARAVRGGGGGGGGSASSGKTATGSIPVRPAYVDSVGKYVANRVDTNNMGPKLAGWIRTADEEAQDMIAAAKAAGTPITYNQAVDTAIRNRTGKRFNAAQAKIIKNHIRIARQGKVIPVRKKY